MKKILAMILALVMCLSLAACGGGNDTPPADNGGDGDGDATPASELNVGVFYYNYSDAYITTVRTAMGDKLNAAGIKFQDYDGANTQATQLDQINTAITNGANMLVSNDVVNSYESCAFVGTDAPEAGHMQGEMIGDFLLANYDTVDLNGDGTISYVMFKGQEGNAEAEYRTQFAVEDANAKLTASGKPELAFYNASNADKYLVDQTGAWSAQAATDYMTTILAEYSEANGNMVELVIANNDGMAEGAIAALQSAGYNLGNDDEGKPTSTVIPVYGVDAMDAAVQKIQNGQMTGTVKQDGDGMAETIVTLVKNISDGGTLMDNTSSMNVDSGVAKIRVPYAKITA